MADADRVKIPEFLGINQLSPTNTLGITRSFDSGATRNDDSEQLDYEGFISPVALKMYAEYMHKHRYQKDGSVRASDNWQKGIPATSYLKSLVRHTMHAWLEGRGYESREGMVDALCGIIF